MNKRETLAKLKALLPNRELPDEWHWRLDLYNANLSIANLSNVKLNWNSHDLLGEILARQAETLECVKLAALVAFGWRFGMCWDSFLELPTDEVEWGLSVLAEAASEDDPNVPKVIKDRMTKTEAV